MTVTKTIEISKQRLSEKISKTKRYLEKESYYVNESLTLRKHLEKKRVHLKKKLCRIQKDTSDGYRKESSIRRFEIRRR